MKTIKLAVIAAGLASAAAPLLAGGPAAQPSLAELCVRARETGDAAVLTDRGLSADACDRDAAAPADRPAASSAQLERLAQAVQALSDDASADSIGALMDGSAARSGAPAVSAGTALPGAAAAAPAPAPAAAPAAAAAYSAPEPASSSNDGLPSGAAAAAALGLTLAGAAYALRRREETALTPDQIARAWRDAEFAETLTPAQRAALPANPAGELELAAEPSSDLPCGTQRSTCNTQSSRCNTQSSRCNTQSSRCNTQSSRCNTQSSRCNTQSSTCSTRSSHCNTSAGDCGAPFTADARCDDDERASLIPSLAGGTLPCGTQSSDCNTQSSACNTQSSSCNTQSSACNTQSSSCNTQSSSCNTQSSDCGAPRTADSRCRDDG